MSTAISRVAGVRAKLLEHFVAGRAGQHEIEDDERGTFLSRRGERVGAGGRRRDAISGFDEMVGDERNDVRFVVHDENALSGDGGRRGHDAAPRCAIRR